MFALKAFVFSVWLYAHLSAAAPQIHTNSDEQLETCAQQLSKYRKFLLQAILSFEDVCDAYNSRPLSAVEDYHLAAQESGATLPESLFRHYQPVPQRTEIWAFFKLLMAQFNDLEFSNVIRDAVIERCRIKSQLQRDEKRNSVVLGKKQRFHSWGGKRSQQPAASLSNLDTGLTDEVHNYY